MRPIRTLSASLLNKSFKKRHVVRDVSLNFKTGEVVGLLGPNGAGKTTCFYMIVGLIRPDSGEVRIDDRALTDLHMYERACAGVGYLPQEASVFRSLSVIENIDLVLEGRGLPDRERRETLDRLIEEFGLNHLTEVKGYALSGGERRRLEVARTLAMDPSFILLDEPFAGIDPIAIADIQDVIVKLKAAGYGIMITDHNVHDTLAITDRAYLLRDGEIMVQGTPDEIVQNEEAKKYYLGKNFIARRK